MHNMIRIPSSWPHVLSQHFLTVPLMQLLGPMRTPGLESNDLHSTHINLATLRRLLTLPALDFLNWICQYYPSKEEFKVKCFPTCKALYKQKVLAIMSLLQLFCGSNYRVYAFLILKHICAFRLKLTCSYHHHHHYQLQGGDSSLYHDQRKLGSYHAYLPCPGVSGLRSSMCWL